MNAPFDIGSVGAVRRRVLPTVNIIDAKTNLSKLVEALETGLETEFVFARDGKPAARIVPIERSTRSVGQTRLGLAEGKFAPFDQDPALDAEIADMFYGSTKLRGFCWTPT